MGGLGRPNSEQAGEREGESGDRDSRAPLLFLAFVPFYCFSPLMQR